MMRVERMANEETWDAIVVGAGAGGLAAACVAAAEGLKTLVVEKSALAGGTTATSGGMVWIPANPKMAAAGIADSLESARRYLEQAAPCCFDFHASRSLAGLD